MANRNKARISNSNRIIAILIRKIVMIKETVGLMVVAKIFVVVPKTQVHLVGENGRAKRCKCKNETYVLVKHY